jgi:SAM-dependent methyltransferase
MSDNWNDIAAWWIEEAAHDPAYPFDVHPLLTGLMEGVSGTVLDLGCGEGQGMRLLDREVIGVDSSEDLARVAASAGQVVVAELPDLSFLVPGTVDGAYAVYLLDLIEDHDGFLSEAARAIRTGGHLVVIMNHPVYTAPGAAPLMDTDGEILWRWGEYFVAGSALESVGPRDVRFFHRPLGVLLTSAARSGWVLERMVERGLSAEVVDRLPGYAGQESIPRLIGVRWRRS